MKKIYLSVMLFVAAIACAPAQETVAPTPVVIDFVPVSHWSFGIKGGANYYRVSPAVVSRNDQFHSIFGGSLEYTINPLVGLGLEYNQNPFGRPYAINNTTVGDFTGSTHDAILYGSISLSNLLSPYRLGYWSKLNVYGDVGVGYSFYNYSLDNAPKTNGQGPMATVGMNVEYNLSKSFSLGLEGQYRNNHRKNIAVTSDMDVEALTATIGLRYKFSANGDKQHARNIIIKAYYPKPLPGVFAKESKEPKVKEVNDETMTRLTAVEGENAALKQKLLKLEDDLKGLSTQKKGVVNASFQNVEFELGSDKLTAGSYATLDQISIILINNPTWAKLNVAGHTDNTGSTGFNVTLSVDRANAVKKYMLAKNVPSASVTVTGYGKDRPIATNDTEAGRQKNRRVEFEITK